MLELLQFLALGVDITTRDDCFERTWLETASAYHSRKKWRDRNNINMCEWLTNVRTLIHELWHEYWYEYMIEEERKEYKEMYEDSSILDFLREYSMKNVQEDFAENFMYLILYKNWGYKDRIFWRMFFKKLQFIEDDISEFMKNKEL